MVARAARRRPGERGGSVLESVIVAPILLAAFLGAVQVGYLAWANVALGTSLEHAAVAVDLGRIAPAAGSQEALDEAVARAVADGAAGLDPERVRVEGAKLEVATKDTAADVEGGGWDVSRIDEERTTARLTARVVYDAPAIASPLGIEWGDISRDVDVSQTIEARTEVS